MRSTRDVFNAFLHSATGTVSGLSTNAASEMVRGWDLSHPRVVTTSALPQGGPGLSLRH
jgi:hypothetical protein